MTDDAPQVVIVGAGPTGVTAATLLAQYGIGCLVLDRWAEVYPQPRAVHMDDEIFRIVARLGIADEFAAISRPALGLRLLDHTMRVLSEFHRDTTRSVHGFPQANMFDQPEFEALLRTNLKRYPCVEFRGDVEVTDVAEHGQGRVRVSFDDRVDGSKHVVEANYVLGCDGANSVVRSCMGTTMHDLQVRPALARRRHRNHRGPRSVGRRAPGLRSGPRRHLHAHRPYPLPLGVPAAARRNRGRLRRPRRAAPPHRSVG